jgi:hypothetical protein
MTAESSIDVELLLVVFTCLAVRNEDTERRRILALLAVGQWRMQRSRRPSRARVGFIFHKNILSTISHCVRMRPPLHP